MFRFVVVIAFVAVASAAPSLVTENHYAVVQPAVLSKTAVVNTTSAITHQSFTNLEKKVSVVQNIPATTVIRTLSPAPVVHNYDTVPFVKTVSNPIVHTSVPAPVIKTIATPLVHTYDVAPVVKAVSSPLVHTYAAAPVVKSVATPVVQTYAATPVANTIVSSVPIVKSVVSSPVTYTGLHN